MSENSKDAAIAECGAVLAYAAQLSGEERVHVARLGGLCVQSWGPHNSARDEAAMYRWGSAGFGGNYEEKISVQAESSGWSSMNDDDWVSVQGIAMAIQLGLVAS